MARRYLSFLLNYVRINGMVQNRCFGARQIGLGEWILDTGYWILDTGYWILDIVGVSNTKYRISTILLQKTWQNLSSYS